MTVNFRKLIADEVIGESWGKIECVFTYYFSLILRAAIQYRLALLVTPCFQDPF